MSTKSNPSIKVNDVSEDSITRDRSESEPSILVVDPSKRHYFTKYQVYILSFEFWYVILGIISFGFCLLSMALIGMTISAVTLSDSELDCDKLNRKLEMLQLIQ